MKKFMIFAALSVLCGFINGLFGTGGGTVCVIIFFALLEKREDKTRLVFANTNFVICILSTVSVVCYFFLGRMGAQQIENFAPFLLPAIAGGCLGAYLSKKISPKILKSVFGVILIYGGVKLVFGF